MISSPIDHLVKIPYPLLLYLLYFMKYLNLAPCVLIYVLSSSFPSTKRYSTQKHCSTCYMDALVSKFVVLLPWNVNIQAILNIWYQNMHNIYLIDELSGITTIAESQKCNVSHYVTEFDGFMCFLILYNLLAMRIICNYCKRLFHCWYSMNNNYYTCLKRIYNCDGCSYSMYNYHTYMTELSYISGNNATQQLIVEFDQVLQQLVHRNIAYKSQPY